MVRKGGVRLRQKSLRKNPRAVPRNKLADLALAVTRPIFNQVGFGHADLSEQPGFFDADP
jgi:hypothetical protein